MAECALIRLKLPGSAEALFPQAKQALLDQGATVRGNAISGSATGPSPVGDWTFTYRTEGQFLVITVTDKPWAVSCARIEAELRAGMSQIKAPAPTPSPAPTDLDDGPGDAAPDAPAPTPDDPFVVRERVVMPGVQRIQVAELQSLLIALGAPTQGLTDGKWGDFTARAMEQVLWNDRNIAYQVYPVSLYEIDVEPDGLLELLQDAAGRSKRNKLWPWGLGLVAVVGFMAWRPGGFARR